MKTVITGLMALVWSLGLHAQVADTAAVAPEVMQRVLAHSVTRIIPQALLTQ